MNKIVYACIGALAGGGLGFLVGWKVRDHILGWDEDYGEEGRLVEGVTWGPIRTEYENMDEQEEAEPVAMTTDKADILRGIKEMTKKRKEERDKAKYVEVESERVVPGQGDKPDISSVAEYVDYSKQYNTESDAFKEVTEPEMEIEHLVYDVISPQEYTQTEPFYEKRVLAWYKDDHILADDDLNVFPVALIDLVNIIEFIEVSGESVYIRVEDKKTDYELYAADGSYEEALEDARKE